MCWSSNKHEYKINTKWSFENDIHIWTVYLLAYERPSLSMSYRKHYIKIYFVNNDPHGWASTIKIMSLVWGSNTASKLVISLLKSAGEINVLNKFSTTVKNIDNLQLLKN